MKPIKLVALFFLLIVLQGCYKDKGNYEYKSIDEVSIDMSNIQTTYTMKRFDTLSVLPIVTYKGQTVDSQNPQFPELQFSWVIYPGPLERANDERLLGNSIKLKAEIDVPERVWQVLFTVTNTNTGVKSFGKFAVSVTGALTEGWMVLYERDGNTDVSLIVNDRITKTAIKEHVVHDLYAASNGGNPLSGKPVGLQYSFANFGSSYQLYVASEHNLVNVDQNSFITKSSILDSMFWTKPSVIAPTFVNAVEVSRREFIINNNKLCYLSYLSLINGKRRFDDGVGGSYGRLAPWVATSTAGSADAAVVYDQTNKKFLRLPASGTDLIPFAQQDATVPFDCNNVGLEFIKSDIGRNYYEHAIMKDDATNKYYLLTSNFKSSASNLIGKGKYDMSAAPEIANLNSMSCGSAGEVLYYSANSSNLYQFKYTAGQTVNLWAAPDGEKITCVQVQKHYNTLASPVALIYYEPKNVNKILYVGTYNEATKEGKVYEFKVDPSSGAILSLPVVYSGFGKIKAMAWKAYIVL